MQDEGPEDRLPPDDRSFLYGDGLFETLLAIDGQLVFPQLHGERFEEGARRLRMACTWKQVEEVLHADTPSSGSYAIRVTVSRGSGSRGYEPGHPQPRLRLRKSPLERDPRAALPPARLGIASFGLADQPLLAGIKHCNRLEQVLAAAEASEQGLDDVVMTDSRGNAQCTASANLFAVFGAQLRTAACVRCGIRGTRRRLVMDSLAPDLGLDVVEAELPLAELRAADALFICNSIIGLRAVASIGEDSFGPSSTVDALQKAYGECLPC